jgi:hypothetical protein
LTRPAALSSGTAGSQEERSGLEFAGASTTHHKHANGAFFAFESHSAFHHGGGLPTAAPTASLAHPTTGTAASFRPSSTASPWTTAATTATNVYAYTNHYDACDHADYYHLLVGFGIHRTSGAGCVHATADTAAATTTRGRSGCSCSGASGAILRVAARSSFRGNFPRAAHANALGCQFRFPVACAVAASASVAVCFVAFLVIVQLSIGAWCFQFIVVE